MEAQFATRGITVEKTKFDYIVASLSPAIATEVRDLILAPPRETPYSTLKSELTKRTAGSTQRKLQQLLTEVELGDRKPTQLLRRMRQLGGDRTEDSFLRELFLQRLPNNVRMVLASSGTDVSLNSLADIADRIMEVSTPSIAAFHKPPGPTPNAEMDSLREDMKRLQEMVSSLSHQSRAPRRFSPSPARRGSPHPARRQSPGDPPPLSAYSNLPACPLNWSQKCSSNLLDEDCIFAMVTSMTSSLLVLTWRSIRSTYGRYSNVLATMVYSSILPNACLELAVWNSWDTM